MRLFHYTHPSLYLFIAGDGLLPHCKELNAPMTGGVPVVWLTREVSNHATAASIAGIVKLFGESFEQKVGEPMYGGTARLAVHLDRADQKLMRYADFLQKTGSAATLKMLSQAARTSWWIYLGVIPPSKIEPITAATMLECRDWHIATHPDPEAREHFKEQREKFKGVPPDTLVDLQVVGSARRSGRSLI
jgi:hypothetical protein